jgi:hypothetical protein
MEALGGGTSKCSFEGPNAQRWLVSIWISLGVGFAAAELLDLDRFLRTWIQGRAFWVYIASYLVVLGIALSVSVLVVPQIQKLSTWWMLILGVGIGFLDGLLAILLNPLLLGKGLTPSWNAWRDPVRFLIAGGLSMGWVYGAIVVLASQSLANRSYWRLAYFLSACAGIRILELALNFFVGGKS